MLKQITVALLVATSAMISQVTFAETNTNSATAPKSSEVVALEKQIAELEKQIETYKKDQEKLKNNITEAKQDVDVKQDALDLAKKKVADYNAQYGSLDRKIHETETRIRGLQSRINGMLGNCGKNQYLTVTSKTRRKCLGCPAHGTCNGRSVSCASGYAAAVNNTTGEVVCNKKTSRCQKGSHESTAWIKARYKNCTNCKTENVKANSCSSNKKAHKHYYCDCDC